jgi:predicted NodU family carbamoyl transferase
MKKPTVVGVNYPEHDTSAALMINGDIVAACEQERLGLQKHSRNFPLDSINECLRLAKIKLENIDEIAVNFDHKYHINEFYLKPTLSSSEGLDFFFKELTKVKANYDSDDHIRSFTGFSGEISFHRLIL